ncbi:helix-turn-helix domain-containing protein [Nocardiopsis coralliicola]
MGDSDSAARRRFGADLRRWRDRSALTQVQLASAVFLKQSQISGLERGNKGTRREHIERMDSVLNAGGSLLKRWDDLNKEDGYAPWFRDVVAIERESTEIWAYQLSVVPGLLQVESYARAVIQTGRPGDTPAELDEAVAARMKRQERLRAERGPVLKVVLEEHVLRRPIGGPAIMWRQLSHLLEASAGPRITIQVIPMSSEVHHGVDGPFILFTVPEKRRVSYVETRHASVPRDDTEAVEDYASVFGDLCSEALPPSASRALIEKIRREYDDVGHGLG